MRIRALLLAAATVVALPGLAAREDAEGPDLLGRQEVLRASALHFPSILASLARLDAATGEVLAAEGAFDLVFDGGSQHYLSGFYDGQVIEGAATRRLRGNGASVYGGYRISDGDFPIYEDESFTNRGGQVHVGALFALLRDREVDPLLVRERQAQLGVRDATLEVLLTRVGVQQRALSAYWNWVATGHQLLIFEDLLRIAEARDAGLVEEVERGARARIQLVENQQNITRRRIRVVEARRDFLMAANDLGFYLRGENGRPSPPARDRLPPIEDDSKVDVVVPPPDLIVGRALARRPELQKLRNAIELTRAEIQLGENALLPRLDFDVKLAHGLGGVGEGGESRDSTDTIVGLTLEVPLQRRVARGELDSARAELDALGQEQRLLQERIEVEVRNVLFDLQGAREMLGLAQLEMSQSGRMVEAERQRFESGASDFFLLNVREEIMADARVRFQEALRRARIARVAYDAATVDVVRLGLDVAPRPLR